VLGVADQIQENLDQLIGVADYGRQIGLWLKIHLNIVTAKRMILQLEGKTDHGVDAAHLLRVITARFAPALPSAQPQSRRLR
jgi:hypothetical protein